MISIFLLNFIIKTISSSEGRSLMISSKEDKRRASYAFEDEKVADSLDRMVATIDVIA